MKDYKNPIKATMNRAKDNLLDIADAIYQQGYEAGKAATPFTDTEEAEKKAYNRGLDEAWEAAKWLYNNPVDRGEDIFNCDFWEIYRKYTAQEVVHKIKEYEDKQKNHKDKIRCIKEEILDFAEDSGYTVDELAEVLAEMR